METLIKRQLNSEERSGEKKIQIRMPRSLEGILQGRMTNNHLGLKITKKRS